MIIASLLFLIINSRVSWGKDHHSYNDEPCKWRSNTGSHYDLQALRITDNTKPSFVISDGDIPCTPETEPTYAFAFNFCADVTSVSVPEICKIKGTNEMKRGAAIQYLNRSDGYRECEVIGHYDESRDDTYFNLIDFNDPSKGVSIQYPFGDKCPDGTLRSAKIDVVCKNVKATILSALEPGKCNYHMVMESMYGCPTQCPITSKGLCNSHGHCAYDVVQRQPYCYCNEGFSGESCMPESSSGSGSSSSGESAAYKAELALLIVLVVVLVVLVGFVAYMVLQVTEFRKQQSAFPSVMNPMDTSGTELTEHHF